MKDNILSNLILEFEKLQTLLNQAIIEQSKNGSFFSNKTILNQDDLLNQLKENYSLIYDSMKKLKTYFFESEKKHKNQKKKE